MTDTQVDRSAGKALIDRAQELGPLLRDLAPAIEADRRVSERAMSAIREAGLFTATVPAAFGGIEIHPREFWRISAEIARGCPAAAWVFNVMSVHNQLLGLFPEQAQHEVFGADPNVGVCGVLTDKSTARETKGGFILKKGVWPFGSGAHNANWMLVGATVDGRPRPMDVAFFLIPMSEMEIMDDWHVSGLKGTGSNSVRLRADELFVPAHRSLAAGTALAHKHGDIRPKALRMPFGPVTSFMLGVGVAIGTAEAALQLYEDFVANRSKRKLIYTNGMTKRDLPGTYRAIAEATARVAAARGLADQIADGLWQIASDDKGIPDNKLRARLRLLTVHLIHECKSVVAQLFQETGASALATGNAIGRLLNDAQAIVMHESLDLGTIQDVYGRMVLGKATNHWLL